MVVRTDLDAARLARLRDAFEVARAHGFGAELGAELDREEAAARFAGAALEIGAAVLRLAPGVVQALARARRQPLTAAVSDALVAGVRALLT